MDKYHYEAQHLLSTKTDANLMSHLNSYQGEIDSLGTWLLPFLPRSYFRKHSPKRLIKDEYAYTDTTPSVRDDIMKCFQSKHSQVTVSK